MEASFTVRPGKPEDSAQIAAVMVESWRATYAGILPNEYLAGMSVSERVRHRQQVLAERDGPRQTFVVEAENGVVRGFGDCGPIRGVSLKPSGEFYAIYLDSDTRNLGLGRALMASMADHLLRHGLDDGVVWALDRNRGACWFYERLGGQRCGERPITFAGRRFTEVGYRWHDLSVLASSVSA
jgi:ribosomal protein S18 acetylase RimI-like enzyme